MPKISRNILFLMTGAAILGGLLWTAFRPNPIPVDIATATISPMQVTLEVDGKTRIRDIFEVSSPIAGTAKRSPVRVGDQVQAGKTVVAIVEPAAPSLLDARSRQQAQAVVHEAQAALAVAESRLQQANEETAYAQSQFNRAKELVERGVASLVRLEDAAQFLKVQQAARDAAQSARAMAQGTLERAEAALIMPETGSVASEGCCVSLVAPSDGRVLSINRISERPVTAGEPLLTIGNPANLEIVADPLSKDAVLLPQNAYATVDRWGGPIRLEARLRNIDPSAFTAVSALGIEEQRVETVFDILSAKDDWADLGHNYAVRLSIVVWETDAALQVPLSALFRSGDTWAVFKVESGTARQVNVNVGKRNGRAFQITSGLQAGDQVIVHPGDDISDGVPVEPIETR